MPAELPSPDRALTFLTTEWPTPFVGRQVELKRLYALLTNSDNRLVTILGPGGMGKTRLAQELASTLQRKFQHGVIFIPLAEVSSGDNPIPVMASALNIQLPLGDDLYRAVLDKLSGMQVLLVLDNFERFIEKALLVHEILVSAKRVTVLVTSREKLNLQGETIYHLDGLQLPGEMGAIAESDAIRLFLQRARQVRPDFVMSPQDAPHVLRVCRLIQGMPLGILLAAAWIEHFSPKEIIAQIEHSLDFLSSEFRNLPERHRSIRAIFDASFECLDENQQTVFLRLAVFRGGFTREAAEAVAGTDLKTLLTLVEKSLLQKNISAGRFHIHELLRQYADERLGTDERKAFHSSHANYFIEFLERREASIKSTQQITILDEIQAELENIRQAWEWAIGQHEFVSVQRCIRALYAFCDMRSLYHDGEMLFRLARDRFVSSSGEYSQGTCGLILLSWYDMIPYSVRPTVQEELIYQAQDCLAQAKANGNSESAAGSFILLGAIATDRGEKEVDIAYYREGLKSHPMLDDFYWVNLRIGISQQLAGQYQESLVSFQAGLKRGRALGERVKTGWALLNMGQTLSLMGKNAEAESHLHQAQEMFEAIGTPAGIMWVKYILSKIALSDGKSSTAKRLTSEALEIANRLHSHLWVGKLTELAKQIGAGTTTLEHQLRIGLPEPLSRREMEILRLLKSELDGPEIARTLAISLNTLRFHTKNIYRKLQSNNRCEAVRQAETLGL